MKNNGGKNVREYKVFDIIGPIMIGPSSSHTAGACRIAKTARNIVKEGFNEVEFVLHGSFAETYIGHGTDRALLAGVLGFDPDDVRLRESYRIADEEGLKYNFRREDLGKVHPNTAKIIFKYPDGSTNDVVGSSIGGGNIEIIEINGISVSYVGNYPTLLLKYEEQKGIIHYVSEILNDNGHNIESMKTIKQDDEVTLISEITEEVSPEVIEKITASPRFKYAKYIGLGGKNV